MFERFTDRARRVIVLAQEEAIELGQDHIGTEHILLGLIREGEGVASQVLLRQGVELEHVRARVVQFLSGYALAPLLPDKITDGDVSVTVRNVNGKKRVSVAFPGDEVPEILEVAVTYRDKEGFIREFHRKISTPKQ